MNENPYSLVFGQEPLMQIDRSMILQTIESDFTQINPPTQANMITGIRGSGKTVILSKINKTFSLKKIGLLLILIQQLIY